MKKQILITIGREYGSGGHDLAALLSQRLGIRMLDRELIDELWKNDPEMQQLAQQYDERPVNRILSRKINEFDNSIPHNVAQRQFDMIRQIADSGESVFACKLDRLQRMEFSYGQYFYFRRLSPARLRSLCDPLLQARAVVGKLFVRYHFEDLSDMLAAIRRLPNFQSAPVGFAASDRTLSKASMNLSISASVIIKGGRILTAWTSWQVTWVIILWLSIKAVTFIWVNRDLFAALSARHAAFCKIPFGS